jgi:hydrogenase maturation protease
VPFATTSSVLFVRVSNDFLFSHDGIINSIAVESPSFDLSMRDESTSDTPGFPAGAARTLIVGFGNPYCGDDGIGPAAARLLHASLGSQVPADLLELSSSALELVERLAGYRQAVIIDALVDEDEVLGTVKPLELVAGRAIPGLGFHTAGLGSALALAGALGMDIPPAVRLYGVVIREPRVFTESLSGDLAARLPGIVREIAAAESAHEPRTGARNA